MLEALDAERLAVAKADGAQMPRIDQWLWNTYGLGGDSLRETFHRLTHESTGPYGIARSWHWPARPCARSARSWRRDRLADPPALAHLARDRVVY
jgi:hypothetical protein